MRGAYFRRLKAALVLYLGIIILCYPMTAQWVAAINLKNAALTYTEKTHEVDSTEKLGELRSYNASLPGVATKSVTDGHLADVGSPQYEKYQQLGRVPGTDIIGQLNIPKLGLSLPIFHGTTDDVLERGVGHLFGTPFPIGGQGTHSVLSAHSGLAGKELFTHLSDMVKGDTFDVFIMGQALRYKVVDIREVLPNETQALEPVPDEDLITLVTCTPIGINSHRLLVTGERVPYVDEKDITQDIAQTSEHIPGFPWWAVILTSSFIFLCGYVAMPKFAGRSV